MLSELGIPPLVVAWIMQDPVRAITVAVCVCTVLWWLLDDDGWDPHAEHASDSGDGGD